MLGFLEVFSVWQWWNYLCSQIPVGKTALRINLDETAICLFQGDGKGNVFMSKTCPSAPVQDVPRRRRRCFLTHVALVCDRTDIQPLLPQVLIANEATFPAGLMPALRAACPANVFLVRQKSSWNNSDLCSQIMRWLGLALLPFRGTLQPVLLLDAVRIHTTPQVLRACVACQIWPLVVPAKTTWLMQPLDTHAFLAFKAHLRNSYQQARVAADVADLDIARFLQCVYDSIRAVLQGQRWLPAFADNGFSDGQNGTRGSIKRQLQVDVNVAVVIPMGRPTLEQLQSCFPRRSTIPTALLWRPFDGPSVAVAHASSSAAARRGSVEAQPLLMQGRTRAAHKMAQSSHAAAAIGAADEAVAVSPIVAIGRRLPRKRAVAVAEELS